MRAGVRALGVALDDGDRQPSLCQVIGAVETDDPPTADDDRLGLPHKISGYQPGKRIRRIYEQGGLAVTWAEPVMVGTILSPCGGISRGKCRRRCSPAPTRLRAPVAVGGKTGELGAGARAARRAVIGLAGAEDEILLFTPALGEAEKLDMIHLGETGVGHCLPDADTVIGQLRDVRQLKLLVVILDQAKPVPPPTRCRRPHRPRRASKARARRVCGSSARFQWRPRRQPIDSPPRGPTGVSILTGPA